MSTARPSQRIALRIVAAAVAGAGMVLTFAPFGAWWLQPFLLAILFMIWNPLPSRRAAMVGFAFGMGWFVTGVSWVYISMHDVGGMPVSVAALATFLFAVILSSYTALAGWLQARLTAGIWTQALLVTPAALTLCEWLRGWVFTGFPWIAPGYAHTDGPLSGFAPLVGVHGVTYVVACSAGVLSLLLVPSRSPEISRKPLVGAALRPVAALALIMLAGSGLRLIEWTEPTGKPLRVSLLQGNIPQEIKFVEGRFESTIDTYVSLIQRYPATLMVLPETALPRMLHAIPRHVLERLDGLARQHGATLITGVPRAESATRYFNSAIALGQPSIQHYDKRHLVPFGEFIPPGFRWFVDLMRMPLGDFTPGTATQSAMQVVDQRVAINICYEDLFGEEIIQPAPGATLLLNISNVAWFGDSLAPHQHLQASRMRALEAGRPMLRATNTGATAVIDHRGAVVRVLPFFVEDGLVAEVQGRGGATPYVRTGNVLVILLCAGVLGWHVWRLRRR